MIIQYTIGIHRELVTLMKVAIMNFFGKAQTTLSVVALQTSSAPASVSASSVNVKPEETKLAEKMKKSPAEEGQWNRQMPEV